MSRCHLFLFLDACGYLVLKDRAPVADLGPVHQLRSVFGYSSACVPSILSGLYPEEHLHWSFFTRGGGNPGLRVPWWIKAIPAPLRDRGRVRSKLSYGIAKANRISGYFQVYQMPFDHLHRYGHCEPRDIFAPGGLNRGTTFIDDLHQRKIADRAFISDWHVSTDQNWSAAWKAATDPTKKLLFLYDASLDGWLHDHTRTHPGLDAQLAEKRARFDQLVNALKRTHGEVVWHIFSDHGMCSIHEHLSVIPLLERSGLRMHVDYGCTVDSTMVRLWWDDDATGAKLAECLAGEKRLTRLSAETLAKERCNFADGRFGRGIWLADPHLLLVPSHMGTVPVKGMHGYSPDHEDTDASWLSNSGEPPPTSIVGINKFLRAAVAEVAAG